MTTTTRKVGSVGELTVSIGAVTGTIIIESSGKSNLSREEAKQLIKLLSNALWGKENVT